MTLDNRFDINKQQSIQSTPTTGSTSASTATESTSKAISFKNTKKSDPLTETIKDEEFQKLSYEQQLETLKKQFPNIDEKELIKTLNAVKTTLEQEKAIGNEDSDQVSTSENLSEEEQILEKYAASIGKNDIDEILMHIKTKKAEDLTEEEQVILKYIEANNKQNNKVSKTKPSNTVSNTELEKYIEKYGDKIDNLISKDVIKSDEWQKKSPMEKMDARADALAAEMIPNYQTMDDKVKQQVRLELYEKIGKILDPEWGNWDIKPGKNQTKEEAIEVMKYKKLQMTAIMLDALETSNKPISTILSKDENVRNEIREQYVGKLIGVVLNDDNIDVSSPEWLNMSPIEQTNRIADSVLETLKPDYKNLSDDDKKIHREKFIDSFAKEYIKDWDTLEDSKKANAMKGFSKMISAVKSSIASGEINSFEDFKKLDINSKLDIIKKYENANNITVELEEIILRKTMRNKGEKFSQQDILNTINEELQNKNLPEDKRIELLNLKKLKEEEIAIGGNTTEAHTINGSSTEHDIAEKYNGDIDKYLEDVAKDFDLENISDIKNNKKAIAYILDNCNDNTIREKICNKLGINLEDLNYSKPQLVRSLGESLVECNIKDLKRYKKISHNAGERSIVERAIDRTPVHFKEHNDRKELGEFDTNLGYGEAVAKSWNNREYVTQEEAIALGRDLNMSENVSNAAKSQFTKAFIETAAQNGVEEQLYFGRELSKIDNAAVTEGLAAASNSVDEQYRSQYNSYVETAMQNYPPEQQANIRSAMKTGEISQETLSQTTPPSGNNAEKTSSSSNTDSVQSSNTNSTTGNINQNAGNIQEVAATSGRTSASNATASAYTNIAAQTQNFTSQLKQQTVTEPTYSTAAATDTSAATKSSYAQDNSRIQSEDNFTTEALQAKKDAVAENIQNYQNKVEESIQGQTTNVSEEDLQYIDNIVQNNTNLSDSEEEKIRQIFAKAGTDVNVIYSIIINKYGSQAQDKFLEVLASNGSSDNIRSFVNSMKNDPSVIKKLYAYCSNQKLRSELLNMLPISDIISMISAGQIKISDLGTNNYKRVIAELKLSDPEKLNELFGEFESDINNKIASGYSLNNSDRQQLRDYLVNNIDSLSNTRFARYLQYLPIDTREELVALKNSPNKTAQSDEPQVQDQNASRYSADAATENKTVASEPSSAVQNSNSNKIKENGNKQDNTIAQQKTQPIFENHEMTKVLNDGTKVKRKESFGAVSDNTDMYEGYEEISQVSENPSMADPVLTPGSYEWQVKYNRQMAYQPPVTQPTNMPLEDDGILLGSNKVSPRLQIDKMKRRGPFYFNA